MLTDKYLKKIKPFISVYKFAYKARFYLITGGVLLAATSASLLGIKGLIYHNVDIRSAQYGESLIYEAKSIFNTDDIKYEFRKIDERGNSKWTKDEPKKVGNYEIRAVSSNIFGSPIYGEPQEFSIKPKKIKPIIDETFTYGETHEVKFDLKEGDEIKFEKYEVASFVNSPKAIFNEDSFKIGNEKNEDVTSCYEIDLSPVDVSLAPRSITLNASLKKTYDGKPLIVDKCDEIIEGTLAYKDTIEVTKSDSIVDAGVLDDNDISLQFNNVSEGNVSLLYNYKFEEHSLAIDKREITISFPDFTKTYDGTFTTLGDFSISEGSLIQGHKFEAEFNQYVDVCDEKYTPKSFRIIDEKGNDVTKNYKVKFIEGNVKINPLEIKVSTGSNTFIYDGESHSENKVDLIDGTLIDGHRLVAGEDTTNKIDVGTYDNNIKAKVLDSSDKDVSSNYLFNYDYGSVVITKRPIEITTSSFDLSYTGDIVVDDASYIRYGDSELVEGHVVKVIPKVFIGSQINESCPNDIEVKILDQNGIDVSQNYDISYNYGQINVIKASLKIKTADKYFMYQENKEYSAPEYELSEDSFLPAGYKIKHAEDYTRVSTPGVHANIINFIVLNEKDEDVTDKFNITVEYGNIFIIDPNDSSLDGNGSGTGSGPQFEQENKPRPEYKPEDKPGSGDDKPVTPPDEPGNKPVDPEKPEGPTEPENPGEEVPPVEPIKKEYKYETSKQGPIYFKQNTYLDLSENIVTKAPNFPIVSGFTNPNLYISNLLNKTSWYTLSVESTIKMGRDLIPQYVQRFDDEQVVDTFSVLSNKENPTFTFNPYDYLIEGETVADPSLISERNKGYDIYEQFVRDNYLGINEDLKIKINELIDHYNLVGETEYMTIYNIARYITKYHSKEIYAGPQGTDYIENFLFGDKKSNELIYALATVRMLRAAGIPARMASGYVGTPERIDEIYTETINNYSINNTWVEVYSSNLKGFVHIDPFRKKASDYTLPEPIEDGKEPEKPVEPEEPQKPVDPDKPVDPEEPEKPSEPEKPEEPGEEFPRDPVYSGVTIRTYSNDWVYDGEVHKETGYFISEGELLPYDRLELVSYTGVKNCTIKEIPNKLKFKVIDTRNNKDVTKEYKNLIRYEYGKLSVRKLDLYISTRSKSKAYDGVELRGNYDDLIYSTYSLGKDDEILPQNVRWISKVKIRGTVKNICKIKKIVNTSGSDVTNNYRIHYDNFGTLTIY